MTLPATRPTNPLDEYLTRAEVLRGAWNQHPNRGPLECLPNRSTAHEDRPTNPLPKERDRGLAEAAGGAMTPRRGKWDLSTLWEGIKARYEAQGRPVPRGWLLVHWVMQRVLECGQ